MRILKKALLSILIITIIVVSIIFISGNSYVFPALRATYMQGEPTAHIDDMRFFDTREIDPSPTPSIIENHPDKGKVQLTDSLKKVLDKYNTVAFMILKDGKLLYEQYWEGYSDKSHTNSFSMAKTVVTLLLGAAIQDGYVKSINQPITDFIPELEQGELSKNVSIGDFASMTSGYDWTEDYYYPINPTAKAYFTKDLEKHMLARKFSKERGRNFIYSSGDIQILSIALMRATKQNLSDYASKKLWKPLGIVEPAYWGLDKEDGAEKGYCCIYSNAMSWAKLGQLMLQKGKWQNTQVIDSSFITTMTTPKNDPIYGYGTWLQWDYKPPFYAMLGHRGQRVIVIPSLKTVITRLGRTRDFTPISKERPLEGQFTYDIVDQVNKMVKNINP